MADILLCSESFIKTHTTISDNVNAKYVLASLREVQEIKLKRIIGENLLETLKDKVKNHTLAGVYQTLTDMVQYYLAYSVIAELSMKVNFKIANAGVVTTPDDKVQTVDMNDLGLIRAYYQDKADSYCRDIQAWLCRHREEIPELTQNDVYQTKATLDTAATCGMWLGGIMGK